MDRIQKSEIVTGPREFSYQELKSAIRGFAFGIVYKAFFMNSGALYAVKRSTHTHEGKREFLAELLFIACLRHKNLAQLQGWCVEKGETLLVYDFMANGSLDHLLRNIINNRENHNCIFELLLASKICGENPNYLEEDVAYAQKVFFPCGGKCNQLAIVAYYLLEISLAAQSHKVASDSQKISRQSEALGALESARRMTGDRNPNLLFRLSLENAEQRKLDVAFYYAKKLVRVEARSGLKGWILLARILSAKKGYIDAENIINAALDKTGKWDQGELLQTKTKRLHTHLKNVVETYTRLIVVLQVQKKSFGVHKKLLRDRRNNDRSLEMEMWNYLANIYTSLSQWREAEVCLLKSEAIKPHSTSRLHLTCLLYEARGLKNEALKYFETALDIEPDPVPSLISVATILRQLGDLSLPVEKSFLSDALRLDRTNSSTGYNFGLLYKSEIGASVQSLNELFRKDYS